MNQPNNLTVMTRSYVYVMNVLADDGSVITTLHGVAEDFMFLASASWCTRVEGLKECLLDAAGLLSEASVKDSHFTTLSRLD